MIIDRDELVAWLAESTTEKIRKDLLEKRAYYCDLLTSGATLGDVSQQYTAKIVGVIHGLDLALNIEVDIDEI